MTTAAAMMAGVPLALGHGTGLRGPMANESAAPNPITGLQALERATGDWGVSLHFFQVSYILAGPWYLTWLTSLTGLVLLFTYGMWFGLVHRRWGGTGLIVFVVGQITVVLAVELTSGRNHAWPTLSAAGLTGVLAAVAAVLLAGGYAVIRRVRV